MIVGLEASVEGNVLSDSPKVNYKPTCLLSVYLMLDIGP